MLGLLKQHARVCVCTTPLVKKLKLDRSRLQEKKTAERKGGGRVGKTYRVMQNTSWCGFDDFPTEVKDWMFRGVRLNLDITGIIRLQPLYLSVPLP